MMTLTLLKVKIQNVVYETEHIMRVELVDKNQDQLPSFRAGAHIDLHISENLIRQYSLSSNPEQRELL